MHVLAASTADGVPWPDVFIGFWPYSVDSLHVLPPSVAASEMFAAIVANESVFASGRLGLCRLLRVFGYVFGPGDSSSCEHLVDFSFPPSVLELVELEIQGGLTPAFNQTVPGLARLCLRAAHEAQPFVEVTSWIG